MQVHFGSFIKDWINAVWERENIRLLIERMERDPHALEDIGLTLDEFANLQWRGLKTSGPLERAMAAPSVQRDDENLGMTASSNMRTQTSGLL